MATTPYISPDDSLSEEPEPLLSFSEVAGIKTPERLIADPSPVTGKKTAWESYSADPSAENLAAMVDSMSPVIGNVLASYQASDDPSIRARARVITARAIQTYDPERGVGLPTWVSSQLRQVSRLKRQSANIMSVPEGVQLDGYSLYKAETEMENDLGREPTISELTERTGLSNDRIAHIRKKLRPVAAEGSYETENALLLRGAGSDNHKEALEYVYSDGDLVDKRLLEMTTGYGGKPALPSSAVMEKLGLTPVQLSRRKARLAFRINKIVDDLENV